MSQVVNSDVATLVAIAVLGPLEVNVSGRPQPLPSPKERSLLAHLAARVGQTVTTDALIETLWGEEPPRTAGKALQNHVVHLRRVLEPEHDGSPKVLVTDSSGYRLALPADAVDANRFEHLANLGRRAYREGRQNAASQTLRSALALWRGEAYLGMESTAIGSREARRLDELRLLALEDCMAAELESGHAREVVPEIEALLPDHPLRERLWLLLVLALYRAGRQGEALAAYAKARETFIDELGVEPGNELRRLHAQVLAQDAALDGPSAGAMLPAALTPPTGAFVGRTSELERLHTAWGRVLTSGQRAVAVVRGPAESGVSRLVAEFAAALADEGVSVRLSRRGGRAGRAAARLREGSDVRCLPAVGPHAGGPRLPDRCGGSRRTADPDRARRPARRPHPTRQPADRRPGPRARTPWGQRCPHPPDGVRRSGGGPVRARRGPPGQLRVARPRARGRATPGEGPRDCSSARCGRADRGGAAAARCSTC